MCLTENILWKWRTYFPAFTKPRVNCQGCWRILEIFYNPLTACRVSLLSVCLSTSFKFSFRFVNMIKLYLCLITKYLYYHGNLINVLVWDYTEQFNFIRLNRTTQLQLQKHDLEAVLHNFCLYFLLSVAIKKQYLLITKALSMFLTEF